METTLLTDAEFHATFVAPMRDMLGKERDVIDIWPYFDAIPASDLKPFAVGDALVAHVYQSGDGKFDHVLIPTTTANVFLVLVVSLEDSRVVGHHVLDLNEKYGLGASAEGDHL